MGKLCKIAPAFLDEKGNFVVQRVFKRAQGFYQFHSGSEPPILAGEIRASFIIHFVCMNWSNAAESDESFY